MQETKVHLHSAFAVGVVDERIFGGFLEHMGRSIYEGVYEPGSIHAGRDGFRGDVLGALADLGMPIVRYPGGNFVSGYHWLDGVGPLATRPTVRELAWQSIEPNEVGTDEFMKLADKLGWSPMLTVNLGTGSPEEARNWLEYCNSEIGTHFADLRAEYGASDPHGVKLWCLGNEMDGPWQLGHVPAQQYAIKASQTAKMMKGLDPSIELVLAGSSHPDLPTYLQWDREVLEHVGGLVEYISLHRYVGNPNDDTADFLAVTNAVDRQIEDVDAICRFVQSRRRSRRRAYLCFDEWNVWYKEGDTSGANRFAPPLIEEIYNLEDALVVAGFLNSFIRHADVVKVANLAQLVNVIAPIQTRGDEMLIQSIYHVFAMFSRRRSGTSLQVGIDGPTYEGMTNGTVPVVDSSAILDGAQLSVFLTNRSLDSEAAVVVDLADADIVSLTDGEIVTGPDAKAANSFETQDVVVSLPFAGVRISQGAAHVTLPPLSAAAITLQLG